jgi:hypothetical protein
MPNSIFNINTNQMKLSKNWPVIALLAALLACMLFIIKRYDAQKDLQEKIDNHSEIIDTAR